MILIALGANIPSPVGPPEQTLAAAIGALEARGARVLRRSSTLSTPSWPDPSLPEFKNAVIAVETKLGPVDLLGLLHEIERDFGRVRSEKNAPRSLDLDLIAYNAQMVKDAQLEIPHPRLHERGFVLYPLQEIAPDWVHPVLKRSVTEMIADLPDDQRANFKATKAA